MKHNIIAVHDRALDAFLRPFAATANGAAIREFTDALADPSSPMHKHPDDYDLYQLGQFDDNTGQLTGLEQGPQKIADGKQIAETRNGR